MRTLFLTAKQHAIDSNAKKIISAHIRSAMHTVSFTDFEMQKLVFEYFDIATPPRLHFLTKSVNLDEAKKHPKIDFTLKVKEFKAYLNKLGINYLTELSTVDVEKQVATANQDADVKEMLTKDKSKVKEPYMVNNLIRDANAMRENLSKKLYGQDGAIESIADSIKNNILASTNSPKSTYLFLGPPATGKTYLAQLMGEHLSDYKIKKFDMTQYSHPDSGAALYGTSRMWGNVKPGALTSFVKNNPKSIIILDEFEKANNQVQTNLLTIFDGGYLQDACGWCGDIPWGGEGDLEDVIKCSEDEIEDIVDFKQTIFVITSNLGKELYSDHKFLELVSDDYIQAESMILDALRREEKKNTHGGGTEAAIVPELVSRFSQANVVLFNKLTFNAYELIADQAFKTYKESFSKQFNISFDLGQNYKSFLKTQILSFAPELDARRLKSKIGIVFFDKVTDYIMQHKKDTSYFNEIKISISKEVNEFIRSQVADNIKSETLIRELFRKNLTLDLEDKFTSKDGVITYKISSCTFKRIKKIKDFSEDGLVFDIPEISFCDIAGHTKAKTRLGEAINFLKDPSLMESFDIKAPKGMLLYGPPGTGKTLLAKAFAKEADLPFISTTGTDLLDPAKTKTIFSKAKEYAPSIVFIDEIDAIGKRGKSNSGREIAINKLLSEMDGFSSNPDENVFVIAATNFKDHIDSAIIRPGRIELHIEINALDKEARKYFIDKIVETKPVEGNFDSDKLLIYTAGMTGAELEMIGKEASIYCIRHGLKAITQQILIEEINTIKYGSRITHRSIEKLMQSTAIHEAGHAVISRVLMPEVKIEQITVVPRANALGFVSYDRDKNYDSLTREDIKNKLCVAFAGREAQLKEYGEEGFDSGASNDLQMATKYAHYAIATLGMGESTGYINVSEFTDKKLFEKEIEAEVKLWLDEAKERTTKLIEDHWSKVTALAVLLQDKEVVSEDELLELMA